MARKLVLGAVIALALLGAGAWVWARTVLTGDNVRTAIASQISEAIGHPVMIGGIGASIYPRVTVDLSDVTIGEPARVRLGSLHVGADFGALLSRRIEHAAVRADRVRIELPLPRIAAGRGGTGGGTESAAAPPVEIVSIDEIAFRNVEVVSGDRTLRGDVELVPDGSGVRLRRIALAADETSIEMTGVLSSLDPLEGEITAKGTSVDFDRMLSFLSEFSTNAAPAGAAAIEGGEPGAAVGRLVFHLTLGEATSGPLTLTGVSATARVTPDAITLDPLAFGVFGGRYEGSMRLALGDTPRFAWKAAVSGVDAGAAMAYAGAPRTISGTLAARLALEGAGLDMDRALRSARGTLRLDVTDGTVANLGLVRTIVMATSMKGGLLGGVTSAARAASGGAAREGERFSRLGATITLAEGVMRTDDLAFQSTDVDLTAAGTITVATLTADLAGRVQLSEALSKEAGSDLYRLTQDNGRITLPATVNGPLTDLAVRVDVGDASRRAIRNRAAEEAQRAVERNLPKLPEAVKNPLKGLIRRRPPG
ncbi:MAG: AsmA-like C-terminal region-containing protein [Acidobacteriota bacterium]